MNLSPIQPHYPPFEDPIILVHIRNLRCVSMPKKALRRKTKKNPLLQRLGPNLRPHGITISYNEGACQKR